MPKRSTVLPPIEPKPSVKGTLPIPPLPPVPVLKAVQPVKRLQKRGPRPGK